VHVSVGLKHAVLGKRAVVADAVFHHQHAAVIDGLSKRQVQRAHDQADEITRLLPLVDLSGRPLIDHLPVGCPAAPVHFVEGVWVVLAEEAFLLGL